MKEREDPGAASSTTTMETLLLASRVGTIKSCSPTCRVIQQTPSRPANIGKRFLTLAGLATKLDGESSWQLIKASWCAKLAWLITEKFHRLWVFRNMDARPRIALLIDTATTWGIGLIEGIARYSREKTDWHLTLGPHGKYEKTLLPENWEGDGVIARVTHQALADQLIRRQIPCVDVSWYGFGKDGIARCTCGEHTVAKLAGEYFIGRGFRKFAYCGSSIRPDYSDALGDSFVETVQKRGYKCHRFVPSCDPGSTMPRADEVHRLASWLADLPKPIALLTFDCVQARYISETCVSRKMRVPHDIAILGGEYDMLSSSLARPQLSSIDQCPREVGYVAASLLNRLLNGEPRPTKPEIVSAVRVVERESTDVVAVDDQLLSAAVRFIQENCHKRIHVGDILKAVPLSRRALEQAFRECLQRSPAEEIRRARVSRAAQLLCDTSWPMLRIATVAGFERPELLTRAFRRELGLTPTDYRRRHIGTESHYPE